MQDRHPGLESCQLTRPVIGPSLDDTGVSPPSPAGPGKGSERNGLDDRRDPEIDSRALQPELSSPAWRLWRVNLDCFCDRAKVLISSLKPYHDLVNEKCCKDGL